MPHAFTTSERKALTPQQKARLFLERGGRCHRCRRKLGPSDKWTDEHVIALQNGGTNAWKNRDVCCGWCFKPKNREDAKKAARGRKVATRACGAHRAKNPMPGSRASKFKKHFDGSVSLR